MSRYIAFLRGMNLGNRRIQNDELCTHFSGLGYTNVAAFLASGNVIFDAPTEPAAKITAHIEAGLKKALHYEVPTFLRTATEVKAISAMDGILPQPVPGTIGKVQVALLLTEPTEAACRAVMGLETDEDRLAIRGRELFWLPLRGILGSELDMKVIGTQLGPMTVRTKRTIERIVKKYLDPF